jgi:hypothetical protein
MRAEAAPGQRNAIADLRGGRRNRIDLTAVRLNGRRSQHGDERQSACEECERPRWELGHVGPSLDKAVACVPHSFG